MIQFEFDEQVGRLKRAYGTQVNDELVSLFWTRFGPVSKTVFASMVDHMIEEKAPLKISAMAEIINAKSRAAHRGVSGKEPSDEEKYPCAVCKTAGIIFAESLDGRCRIMVRCSCEIWGGKVADANLPQWSAGLARDFIRRAVPPMRPDLTSLRNDPRLEKLSDDEFFSHPNVRNALLSNHRLDWWAAQKEIASQFWREYFESGMNR